MALSNYYLYGNTIRDKLRSNGRAKSYREVEIKGKNAQHSKLHENKEVDKLLIDFLWKE